MSRIKPCYPVILLVEFIRGGNLQALHKPCLSSQFTRDQETFPVFSQKHTTPIPQFFFKPLISDVLVVLQCQTHVIIFFWFV